MNERLKKLAEEATDRYDRLGFEKPFAQPNLELYGLLIIEECCKIATYPQLDDEQSYYGNLFAKSIREHFKLIQEV